ncbi:MAG: VOC family protein [Candidatus Thiodiazotropha sp. (ex Dulcina madagascariensis)]|nr:VOC family protein [Candidatus Thiodiazotropha sp. (ex Epidulcina cf. delphinae)]MCU7936035.1 VOC family protein [Candidatus Thiodiazotropha sp. (ex Dulcina madagascariensis)]
MENENPSIISHLSVGTNDFERAVAFYDKVLLTLGCKQLMKYPGAAAYGREYPEFWVQIPIDGKPATVGNGSHIGFVANSKETVHAFHEAALDEGGKDDGAPGPRPDYGESYYGCFIRDLDGNKIEATFWDEGPK